jgi:plasmid stabilization system protein ParE
MNVFLTKRAVLEYEKIHEFIRDKWGDTIVLEFEERITAFLELLPMAPDIGIAEKPINGLRSFQVTKQTRIFYKFTGNRLKFLCFAILCE